MNQTRPAKKEAPNSRTAVFDAMAPRRNSMIQTAWNTLTGLWRRTPVLARGLAVVVPLMVPTLFLASGASNPKPTSTWQSLQDAVRERATIDVHDDFRSGLAGWLGDGAWANTWTYDKAGFVMPKSLAIFKKSIPLTNYRLEFLAQIENKALSFVVRAPDTRNYHAVKIVIVEPGPLPKANIVRYSVINGQESQRSELPLPLAIRNDTLYRVVVTAQGGNFTTSLNGQMVDSWSDDRLMEGGVGFFADKDSSFRLRWVRVVDKDDFLGWLCSQFSPKTADRSASSPTSAGTKPPGD